MLQSALKIRLFEIVASEQNVILRNSYSQINLGLTVKKEAFSLAWLELIVTFPTYCKNVPKFHGSNNKEQASLVWKYNLFFKDAFRNDLMWKTDMMQSKSYGMFEKRFRCSGC